MTEPENDTRAHAFDALLAEYPTSAESAAHVLDGISAGLLMTARFAATSAASVDRAQSLSSFVSRLAALLRLRAVDPSGPGPDPG